MAPEEAHWLDATIATLREELWRAQEDKALLDQEARLYVISYTLCMHMY